MLLGEGDEVLVEIEARHIGGRVGRIADHHRGRLRDRVDDRAFQRVEEIRRRLRRHRAHGAARHQEAEGVDRVARIGHQHDVARRGDRLRHIGKAFLGAQRGDDLGFGIELHAEAALVIFRLRQPQLGNAARGRIAVGARLAQRLLELLDDMGGRRQIGIAHAEIDDVGPRIAGARLGPVHLFEHVRRQAADAVEIFHRLKPLGSAALSNRPALPRLAFITGWSWRQRSGAILGAVLGGAVLAFSAGFFLASARAFCPAFARFLAVARRGQLLFQPDCSSSLIGRVARGGGMSCTAGY